MANEPDVDDDAEELKRRKRLEKKHLNSVKTIIQAKKEQGAKVGKKGAAGKNKVKVGKVAKKKTKFGGKGKKTK